MADRTRDVHGRRLELSSSDKIFFPEAGITKGDVVDYYERVADTILPHVRDRFISMHRWPDGITGEGFYQKRAPDHFPAWIRRETVAKKGGSLEQIVVDEAATLVFLADQACITPHMWLSRSGAPRRPDRMVFDLDPSRPWEEAFDDVRWAAGSIRAVLEGVGLKARVMTSGSRGLHLHVALDGVATFDETKAFARRVADLLARRHPERLTTELRKKKRGARIFVDYLRNQYAQTTVTPYAVRALPGAPVATPLDWDELSRARMGPRRYTVTNLFRRLGRKADPWADFASEPAGLAEARRALEDVGD